jgi:predicted amidohydrolase YtcJ
VLAHWFIANTGDDAQNLAQVARAVELAGEHRPWLKVAGIKLVLDGVIDACTAAMRHPYADGSNAEPIWPLGRLQPVVAAADAAGLQVAMHAIGDLASDVALDALEHAHAVNGEQPRRHRIEHLEYAAPETAGRMAALGVTASMQPVHADPAIWPNWAAMLGDERADRGFAWTEFREAGALLAFSTDAPTAPHEALPNLYIAVTRRSALDGSYPANHPEYAIPLADAIAHATRDAAASCREEHERGRIAPGLAADFAVLDRDPFTEGAEVLLEARVVRTVVAGHPVYEAVEASVA